MSIFCRFFSPQTTPLSPEQFARRLRASKQLIMDAFLGAIQEKVPGAKGEPRIYLRDHLPDILDEIASYIGNDGQIEDYIETTWLAAKHGLQRAQGEHYQLSDLQKEYRIFRQVLLAQLDQRERLSEKAAHRFADVYEASLTKAVETFVRHSASEFSVIRAEQKRSADDLQVAKAGQAESESERRRFEEVMNRLPNALLFVDMPSRRISFTNLAAQKMLGIVYAGKQPVDVYGTLLKATDGDGNPLSGDQIPSARTFRGETINGDEMILTTPVGEFHVKVFSEQFPQTPDRPASALILLQDITALKRTENTLRKTQTDLNEAVEIAQVGFWHLDVASQDITVTNLLLQQFGIDQTLFKGTLPEALQAMHPDDRERVSAEIKASIADHAPYHTEYRVVHAGGLVRWLEARGSVTYDGSGTPLRFTGTTIDVTERVLSRQVLEQSESDLRTLADSMPQNVWIADADGLLTYFNKNWFDYSGSTYEENAGTGWSKFVHPDDLAATAERWNRSLAESSIYENEFRLRDKKGNYRWHVARAIPSKDASGKVVRWYGTNTDIHDFKTLAEQLKTTRHAVESERQKFKTIFADASTPMALLQGKKFVYEIVNPSYLALFNNRDLIGKEFLVALPELEGQSFPLQAKSVFETGVPYVDKEAQAFLKRRDDSPVEERYFDQSYTRILDESGAPYGVLIHAREITDLVFARRELEQSAERYRIAVETANMGTWEVHPQTNVVHWSERTNELFGVDRTETVPLEKAIERIHPEDQERVRKAIEAAMDPSGDGNYDISYRILHASGEIRWVSLLGKAFFSDTPSGRVTTLFTGNVLDVTDQVLAEANLKDAKDRAERANAAKSQFLANMSHEIRTPLGAIMGFSSLLKDRSLGQVEQDSFLSVIERNSTQLLRIIDDILDLSKVEAGMMLIEQIEFSLPEMLTDFSSLMGFKAREKGIGFSSRAVTPLPKIVNSDPTRLRQILMNVVGNAIKFTDHGRVELRCSYQDGLLDFEVEDSGRGISSEQEQNLFQPFTQADTSTTRKYGGTGLGLVLTRSLTEALGGHFILKKSALGQGSVFSIRIKVTTPPQVECVTGLGFETVPVRSVISVGQLAGLKVLLVEDSPDNQALISIFLGRAGARTDIASDGEQGYKMALGSDYDVVLMDVQMPVMDGITAIKKLRAEGFRGTVIALTAHAMKEERVRCINAGFTDFLSKPLTREDLINTILRYKSGNLD